jgi:uncharacterized protein YecT (DUF1311 family)
MLKTLLCFLLLAGWTFADTTPAELKKAKADHAKSDTKLNAAYKAAMATLDDSAKDSLKKDQRAWLGYRDDMAKAQVKQSGDDPEKPEASAAYWDMMAGLCDERAEWLGSYTNAAALPAGLTGEWMDSRGGHVYLQERKDGVAFGIEVVRTRAFNLGGIAGLAKKTDQGADFVDKATADQPGGPCKLFFTVDAGKNLTVRGENTDIYHGHGAYFDGVYRKVAKLKKPVSTTNAPNDPEEGAK